ncbi:MAG: phenylacetate-CoA oxygenase subunit PaaJ [Bacteroidetes bacterium]|nr:phenylacetate-CoA oxygenase subunit PaaJ [Bacteroidota bacterium]
MVTEAQIWELLERVPDPEVPVLSVVDLGIVRKVELNEILRIDITPTYSGCPAMGVIEEQIKKELINAGIENFEVNTVLSPAWTTDWLSENGRKKLKEYGIAPPENEMDKSALFAKPLIVPCPNCDSRETRMVSEFGSTACKAHYVCKECREPFDYFKCLR